MFLQFLHFVSYACMILTERALIEAGARNTVSATAEVACTDRLSVIYHRLVELGYILDVPPRSCRLTAPKLWILEDFASATSSLLVPTLLQ